MSFKNINGKIINLKKINYFTKWYRSNHTKPYVIGASFDNGKFEILYSCFDSADCDIIFENLNSTLEKVLRN
jgi:hypothetical protein